MGYIIISFLIAAIITYLAIPVIINIAIEKKLVDMPDDDRKVHKDPIPSLGGIGVFAGFIISALFMWPYRLKHASYEVNLNFEYVAAACLIIFFLGLKDDILDISPLKKFIGQLLAAWLLVYKCNLQIDSFYGVFGIAKLPAVLSLFFTYLAIVLITNSYNLIDGIDGLSGTLAVISLLAFTIYFYSFGTDYLAFSYIAAALIGGVAAFLIYNYHPAKIFMGDTGSLLIGLVNAMLLIQFLKLTNNSSSAVLPESVIKGGPIVGLSIIFIPLFDTVRVFAMRILKGRSPFSPDRHHIHHLLLDRGFNHNKVTLILAIAQIVIIGIAYLCNYYLVPTASLFIVISCCLVGFVFAYYLPKKIRVVHQTNEEVEPSKVVNIQ